VRKCPKCKKKFQGRSKICRDCGSILDDVESLPEEPRSSVPPVEATLEVLVDPDVVEDVSTAPGSPPAAEEPRRQACARCGSEKVIPDVKLIGRPQGAQGAGARLKRPPFVFKDRIAREIGADICGECGHVELRAQHAGAIYQDYLRSLKKPPASR
jgi:hypothetical protein